LSWRRQLPRNGATKSEIYGHIFKKAEVYRLKIGKYFQHMVLVTWRNFDVNNSKIKVTWARNVHSKICLNVVLRDRNQTYRVAQKSKPPPIFQKIVLKIANEIRFLRKGKV